MRTPTQEVMDLVVKIIGMVILCYAVIIIAIGLQNMLQYQELKLQKMELEIKKLEGGKQ